MPTYLDPQITTQLWCAQDAINRGVSATYTKDMKDRPAMTSGTLYLPHFPAHPNTQIVTVFYNNGSKESADNLAQLNGITNKGTFKLVGASKLDDLPKERLETAYEWTGAGTAGNQWGISHITLTRHQEAVPHVLRGIRELPTNPSTEEIVNTINQLIKNAREAGLMGRQTVAHIPIDGIDIGGHGDDESGVDIAPS